MSEEKANKLMAEADSIFEENEMSGGNLHSFFRECLNPTYAHVKANSFYIDDRIEFERKNRLYEIMDELSELGY